MGLLVLLAATASLLGHCQTDEKVSFYGASYMHFPVQEAKGGTDISFRFRTHLPDAMLLLAAGKTDYCLIKLEAGRLKVHINLGAGESEMASARGLTLNDLTWHDVNLTRREANITLQIDVIHTTTFILPGRFFELNIHYGVYIGGQGDFNELFLGHTDYLRGCMAVIIYNGANVIEYAKSRKSNSEATSVSWSCSNEFDASRESEISFVDEGAFISIPRPIPRSGSSWELELKTVSESGLLMYNTGHTSYADYLGIELHDSKIRVVMNKGNGPSELTHPAIVSDGKWHNVTLTFNPSAIGISVNSQEKIMNLPLGGNRYLDLAEILYIGGTELNKRARAIGKGLKSGDKSYSGCLRGMVLNGKPLGLPDAKVSQGILVGCVWKYRCSMAKQICDKGSTCQQFGVADYQCLCNQPSNSSCTRSDGYVDQVKENDKVILPVNLDILSLTQLSVAEGQFGYVDSENIEMVLDIAKYGINDNHVTISMITPPEHGIIKQEQLPLELNGSFTLRDVDQRKIQYIHDGSETTEDIVMLELKLRSGSGFKLPNYLHGGLRFPLNVNITPVNDPPVLEIPTSKTLRLAQGTKKALSKELVWTSDVDTPAETLTYTVLKADADAGHVERLSEPGRRIESFTQAELQRGTIAYVHRGNAKDTVLLGLQVSDGLSSTQPRYLRISAYPLQLKLQHNTGLVVVHRSYTYLRPSNMSFATNSDDASIEIRYDIVNLPEYGVIQKSLDSEVTWETVHNFTSKDVESKSIRYLHTIGSPAEDGFEFQASVREVKTQQNFYFRITFIDLEIKEATNVPVEFTNATEIVLSCENLQFQTNPIVTQAKKIKYVVTTITKFGHTILGTEIVRVGDIFTQEDVDSGRLKYRLYRKTYSTVNDQLTFDVSAPQCQQISSRLSIRYFTGRQTGTTGDYVESLKVIEGSKVPLRIISMDSKSFGTTQLAYNLTSGPSHGWLTVQCRINETTRTNTTYFTTDELTNEDVYYHHDDSETRKDSFTFVATSIDNTDFMYVGKFNIEISLQNDNPPELSIIGSFNVVTNGECPFTEKDLVYIDKDTDTKPEDLIYTKKSLSNGEIYNIDDTSIAIEKFTQQDVNNRKILFKHRGEDHGSFEFTVSDGRWSTKGVLDIEASPPYIRFRGNNSSIVPFNASVSLSLKELDVETNFNANDKDIKYGIVGKPKHGILMKNNKETNNFSREDLSRGIVVYRHLGGSMIKDEFKIKATIRGVSSETRVTVKVYSKIYWEPLTVQNNRSILVEETTSVCINKKSLEITHSNISSSEITYLIREWPKNGYIEVQSYDEAHSEETTKEDDDNSLVRHFDQNMINEGRVYYVQSASNETKDKFVVDVTNGVTYSRGLVINFVIIPDKIYVETSNLTVVEGKTVVISSNNFHVKTNYFAGKITDYKIINKPKYGSVIDSTKNNQIKKFSQKHLNAGVIVYKHNGDESSHDGFRLVLTAGDKTSQPVELAINVEPVNDEIPVLVNRSVINVWQGGCVVLNHEKLASLDNDTKANELKYNLTNVKNGFISTVEKPELHISYFTQDQLDQSEILFTHTNGSEAAFSFVLFDGVHTTMKYEIPINTLPIKLHVESNSALNIFPLTRKSISSNLLLTSCSDPVRNVNYIVRQAPNLGKIIMETSEGIWQEVDRFTQKDVNESRVTYEHTKQFMDLSINDSFVFDVETEFADTITNEVFRIDVSVSSGGLDRYIQAKTVRVEEGGSAHVVLNLAGIVKYLRMKAGIEQPMVLSKLWKQPIHGHVMLLPDMNITTFTQMQIEDEKIGYFHDHSDTLEDRIVFSIYLSPGHVMLCNTSVPVVISPINDEPFKLITNEPYITVVQNQTQTITRENLLTTDPDTGPEELVYDLISGPTYGRLLLPSMDQNISEVRHVTQWTQQDVDSNRLVYEHNGTTQTASFYFRVSDHSFNPIYKMFTIHVLPIRLNVSIVKPISLPQGSSIADVSEDNIRLDTNARQDQVIYEITRVPKHGNLYLRDIQAEFFKHVDLQSKSVAYMQTDMNAWNDSFELSARIGNFKINNVMVDIKVVPLIISETIIVFAGEKNQLSRKYIDATPLYELTKNNPVYHVTRKPKYCKLKRIVRSSGEKRSPREREVSRFTHLEITSKVMYLVCKRLPTTEIDGTDDSFDFKLSASTYQPAMGIFRMSVRNNVGEMNSTLSGPMDPVGHEGEMAIAPNLNNDYILIYGMVAGFILLTIVVIITIKCRQNRYKHNEEDKSADGTPAIGVIPLPRPPDHLMPATPLLKRFGADHSGVISSTPVPVQATSKSTLPQCKVIPLNTLDSVTASDADVSGRYPYGVADGDEWSSFDTVDLQCQTNATRRPNPLLRRNQYWV